MTWAERRLDELVEFVKSHEKHCDLLVATDVVPSVLRVDCLRCSANIQIKVDLDDNDPGT